MSELSSAASGGYVLGIDLGSHSLGWAALDLDDQQRPCRIRAAGVRIFQAGKDATRDQILQGLDKQKSRAADRRQKRLPRRQFWRRARRRYNVMKCLISHGLLRSPGSLDIRQPADQDAFLKAIDVDLHSRLRPAVPADQRHLWEQVWLYELRAAALERKLDPLELGRAFYHLAQRRGFLSNRKTDAAEEDNGEVKKTKRSKKAKQETAVADDLVTPKDDGETQKEDPKKVKAAIEQLDKDMHEAKAPTLGVFFARHINPHERRIRQRWTSRAMYEAEFNAIWDAQQQHHPDLLTEEFRRALGSREQRTSMFFQRPLKPAGHLVGHCDLEPRRKRAPQGIPVAQRFRLLQKVNDLTVMEPAARGWRKLEAEERKKLLDALCTDATELNEYGDMSFDKIRKLLGFKTTRVNRKTGEVTPGHEFKLEAGPEKNVPGDRTFRKMATADAEAPGIVGRWREMSERQRESLVLDLLDFRSAVALTEHLQGLGFSPAQAVALAKVKPEDKRCSLSRRAMSRLLPFMEEGMAFATAKEQIPEYCAVEQRRTEVHDVLPRVMATDHKHLHNHPAFKGARDLRNPAVTRGLAELRKVVNALIQRYGKPQSIRIELGRELKKTPRKRAELTKNIEARKKARDAAVDALIAKANGFCFQSDAEVREADKQKYLLYQEQKGFCPYCGKYMEPSGIRSGSLQMDHIIPYSVCLDNMMFNKTLCHAECNWQKAKQTPMQAWGNDPQKMHEIELAVAKLPPRKRERFGWTDEDLRKEYGEDFTRRQLQDTQYASRLAAEYLGLLYGGGVDESGTRRVLTPSGGVTAILRDEWKLNDIIPNLPDSPAHDQTRTNAVEEKLRTDHRHHAVDAIVIALTDQRAVGLLSRAAATVERAERERKEVRDSQGRPRRRFAEIGPPHGWQDIESFRAQVRSAIAGINASHRSEHKLNGALHDQSNYSKAFTKVAAPAKPSRNGKRGKAAAVETERRIRKPLSRLTEKDLDTIVDEHVREAVRRKLQEHRDRHAAAQTHSDRPSRFDPMKVWTCDADYPILGYTPDNKPVYVKSVRVRVGAKPVTLHAGSSHERYIKPGANHHMTVLASVDSQGKEVEWVQGALVSRLDAMRRKRAHQPVIDRTNPPLRQFKFSLRPGDILEMERPGQPRRLYVVRSVSDKRIEYVTVQDARKSTEIQPPKKSADGSKAPRNRAELEVANPNQWLITTVIDHLRQFKARKVTVSPIGEVHPAND